MYSVESVIRGHRYVTPDVQSEEGVRRLIQNTYAAWGIRWPASIDETNAEHFAAQLAEKGFYVHVEAVAETTVRRAAPPQASSDMRAV